MELLEKATKTVKTRQTNRHSSRFRIFRTKANCLRVCCQGPILVVYPDGVWYRQASPEVIERIIQEHLISNQVVQEYAFLTHRLPEPVILATETSIQA